jgi:hypothetical protein
MNDFPDDPNKRHHHPNRGGSADGAYAVSFRAGTQKHKLLKAYDELPDGRALTDDKAAQRAGLLYATYWMRCSELREGGFIKQVVIDGVPQEGMGLHGSPRMLCHITAYGRAFLEELEEG